MQSTTVTIWELIVAMVLGIVMLPVLILAFLYCLVTYPYYKRRYGVWPWHNPKVGVK